MTRYANLTTEEKRQKYREAYQRAKENNPDYEYKRSRAAAYRFIDPTRPDKPQDKEIENITRWIAQALNGEAVV